MIFVMVLLTSVGTDPGPFDAFRANYASLKVDVDYQYRCGFARASTLDPEQIWTAESLIADERPEFAIDGTWSCDGSAEGYRYCAPPEIAEMGRRRAEGVKSGRFRLDYVPAFEAISDGTIFAGHHINEALFASKTINVWPLAADSTAITCGGGAFSWWPGEPFPRILSKDFAGIVPRRATATWDGHATEVEICRRQYDGYWRQLEVSYDPSIDYLPRHARLVEGFGQAASIRELYLLESKPCGAGGFVPMEWYATAISLDRFSADYPSYTHETLIQPLRDSFVGHFKATGIRDRLKPVELDRLDEVVLVSGPGGQVRLDDNPQALTLSQVKSILGKKRMIAPATVALPTIDRAESEEFTRSPRRSWFIPIVCLLAVALIGLYAWKRPRTSALLIALTLLSGCGHVGPPVPKLSAALEGTPKVYDLGKPTLEMTLVVRNDGNVPLQLFKGDGGCSCREVDRGAFPASIQPGQMLPVKVKISHGRRSSPQSLPFAFETDHGTLSTIVPLYALPRHQLSPEAPSAVLREGDDGWEFNLVHRAIFGNGRPKDRTNLECPPEFALTDTDVRFGEVAGGDGLEYEDRTYHVTLRDHGIGLHKALFRLVGTDRKMVAESSVVWRREPYLSTTPESIALGDKPSRVFLRCPDEDVELTEVVSAPTGIKAMLASPREVIVQATKDASRVMKGEILVATSARDHPPLRIPVVRYSAPPSE